MGLDLRKRQRGGVVAAMLVPEGIAGATSVHSSRRRLLPGCRGWRNRGCYVEAQSLSRRHGGKHKMRMRIFITGRAEAEMYLLRHVSKGRSHQLVHGGLVVSIFLRAGKTTRPSPVRDSHVLVQ